MNIGIDTGINVGVDIDKTMDVNRNTDKPICRYKEKDKSVYTYTSITTYVEDIWAI